MGIYEPGRVGQRRSAPTNPAFPGAQELIGKWETASLATTDGPAYKNGWLPPMAAIACPLWNRPYQYVALAQIRSTKSVIYR